MVTLEHVTRFAQPTGLSAQGQLQVQCAQEQCKVPVFFTGRLLAPRRTADLLLALSRVVASRFHVPPAMLARILRESDPVITCASQRMRWEGFSACCSAYARLDLLPNALQGALLGVGTTNVDLGPEARAALARLGDRECQLQVGAQAVELQSEGSRVVERRVPLPLRWLKGFVEVQAIMAQMTQVHQVSAAEGRRFLQGLPKGPSRGASWVVASGKGLRLSQVPCPGALALAGWQRLTLLQDILRHASQLRIYRHPGGSSAWELVMEDAHFFLVLSPDVWRGFSGEGQVLTPLSSQEEEDRVLEFLDWSGTWSIAQLEERAGKPVETALARLASRGLVGFDLAERGYFRRHLPYRYDQIEALHPRLLEARKLKVEWNQEVAWVESGDTRYRVAWEGNQALCNCPWFAQHALQRGPCKHILAAHMDLS